MRSKYIQYYVEGEDEEKLVNVLKSELRVIRPGKVQKLNVVEQEITDMRLRTLNKATMVVLVFDTDTGNVNVLNKNIKTLQNCSSVSEIVLIPQVANLEHELVRSCNIKKIEELLNSKSRSEFKSDLIHVTNLGKKLQEHRFDINRFWSETPTLAYQEIRNQASKIKLVK
ncbi:MAG: hypothetical protein J6J03_05180 [Tyzzerella sp.]|nr:hypothetical protein [Tyzzerella sp.]